MFPVWVLVLFSLLPSARPAALVAAESGASCDRGCLVGEDGWVYEVTRNDLLWFGRMAHCEIGSVVGTDDSEATLWAVATNFYRRHLVGRRESLGWFASHYSGCTSPLWATGGKFYSPRITPLADANRKTRWDQIPLRTRDLVLRFLSGDVPNRWPGWCYVWTHGWEDRADPRHAGPFYAVTDEARTLNAYYADPMTVDWTPWTVQIVSAGEVEESRAAHHRE